ncbi:MAG: hypothetical protein HQM10_19585 [Candidatus Riflebacteria bacterium]|nr:hypothetical protein [Candidatus Riflebacteria bacterium]
MKLRAYKYLFGIILALILISSGLSAFSSENARQGFEAIFSSSCRVFTLSKAALTPGFSPHFPMISRRVFLSGQTGKTSHAEQRAEEAKTDPNRQVGDPNRVVREGKRYINCKIQNLEDF